MVRIKRGNIARKRRNKVLSLAKSFRGRHSSLFRVANQQTVKSLLYAYIGRREKKRTYRKLWIIRINAAVRIYNINYSKFIFCVKQARILLNRKMLSQLAIIDPCGFFSILSRVS